MKFHSVPEEILAAFRGWKEGERHETKAHYTDAKGQRIVLNFPWCDAIPNAIDRLRAIADGQVPKELAEWRPKNQ